MRFVKTVNINFADNLPTFPITKSSWSYLKLLLICLLELGFGFDQSLPRGKPVGKSPYYRSFDRSANWRVKDSIGSNNGLSPARLQAFTWTNDVLLPIGHIGTNLTEIWITKYKNFQPRKRFESVFCKPTAILSGSQRIDTTNVLRVSASPPRIYFYILLYREPIFTHLSLDVMAIISQTIFSDAFSWMKSFAFWLKFYWTLFLRVQ